MNRARLIIAIRCVMLATACLWLHVMNLEWLLLALLPTVFSGGATSPCTYCTGGTQNVVSVQFDIAGVQNFPAFCCTNLNATFILNWNAILAGSGSPIGDCAYYLNPILRLDKSIGQPCSQPTNLTVQFEFWWNGSDFGSFGSSTNKALAYLDDKASGGGEIAGVSSTLTYPYDCSSAADLSALPMTVITGALPPTQTNRCTYTTATVTVTP